MNSLSEKTCKEILEHLDKAKELVDGLYEDVDRHYSNCIEDFTLTVSIHEARDGLRYVSDTTKDIRDVIDELRHFDLTPCSPGQTSV